MIRPHVVGQLRHHVPSQVQASASVAEQLQRTRVLEVEQVLRAVLGVADAHQTRVRCDTTARVAGEFRAATERPAGRFGSQPRLRGRASLGREIQLQVLVVDRRADDVRQDPARLQGDELGEVAQRQVQERHLRQRRSPAAEQRLLERHERLRQRRDDVAKPPAAELPAAVHHQRGDPNSGKQPTPDREAFVLVARRRPDRRAGIVLLPRCLRCAPRARGTRWRRSPEWATSAGRPAPSAA